MSIRRVLPAAGALLVIAVLGAIALRVGSSNLADAERTRLQARITAVDGLAENAQDVNDANTNLGLLTSAPFAPELGVGNASLLTPFVNAETPGAVAALVGRDGTTIASRPEGRTIVVDDLGAEWSVVLSGRATTTDTFTFDGALAQAVLLPVGGVEPWAVVVSVLPAAGGVGQAFFEKIGSLNGEPGGFTIVDRQGVAFNAWASGRLGEQVVTPQEVAALTDDEIVTWTADRDGREVTYVGTRLGVGYALVFEQETDLLYGDLRDAERQRSRSLVVLLVIAVGGIAGIQLLRERTARREGARVEALLRNSQDLILVARRDGRLQFVSPAIEGVLGHAPDDWHGRPFEELAVPTQRDAVRTLVSEPTTGPLRDVELVAADGRPRWFDIDARDLTDHSEVGGILFTCHEVGARKELQDELLHQSTHDRLTGLPDRQILNSRLDALLAAGPERPFALLYVDLDRFKPVNDTLGHDAGDDVLQTISRRLVDVAEPDAWPARLGGDEFAILSDGCDEACARELADRVREAVRAPIAVGTTIVNVDASIGVVVVDSTSAVVTADQLIRIGDEAMYEAKRGGRGSVAATEEAALAAPPSPALHVHRPDPAGVEGVSTADASSDAPTPVPSPLPATVARRRRWTSAVPILLAIGVVAIVGYTELRQTEDRRVTAERNRVEEQARFTVRAAAFYSGAYDADNLSDTAGAAPWAFDGGPVDQTILEAFANSGRSGDGGQAILFAPSGEVVATHPAGASTGLTADHPAWEEVLGGASHQLASVSDPDVSRSYYLLPIEREGDVVALLGLGLSLVDGPGPAALEQGGSGGQENGGWSLVDDEGVIYVSWNPDLVGTRIADPDALRAVPVGESAVLSADGTFVVASPMTSTYEPTYLVFSVPEDEFFADLRVGLTRRDASYGLVIAAMVVGLVVSNHRRERAVRRSEERLTALLSNANDLILVLDRHGDVQFISSAVEHLLGYPAGFRLGHGLIDLVHPDDRHRAIDLLLETTRRGATTTSDIRVVDVDGRWRWFDLHGSDLRHHSEIGGLLLTCHDVTVRHQLQERLRERARRDALTGLANRRRMSEVLHELSDGRGERFALLFIDLDEFKPVNDELGHDAGDEVLRVVASRVERSVRTRDASRPDDLVCRLGGDEFAVLLRDADEASARVVAERLTQVAAEPIDLGARTVRVSASIGVALSHPDTEDPAVAVQRADQAMYRAKATAPGTYSVTAS